MRPAAPAVALLLLAVGLAGCSAPSGPPASPPPAPPAGTDTGPPTDPRFRLERLVSGLAAPVGMVDAGDGRMLIVEQGGTVRVWKDGALLSTPFLDVHSSVSTGGEQGLLSIALDPLFASNGGVIASYTDGAGDSVIARYKVGSDPDRVDASGARQLLKVDQPFANHNGGLALYGPDGMLWVGFGDGGSGGDPQGNGQKLDTLLGKLLRIDARGDSYSIPADNPYADRSGCCRGEIWAYGLRNPWRFGFDRATHDLYIADVGQNQVEEVNWVPAGSAGGENFGWNVWEGSHRYRSGDTNGPATSPVAEYTHDPGGHCSVTGGFVYRGASVPSLRGVYVYGDYCSGTVWGLWSHNGSWVNRELKGVGFRISSFAEDHEGELYVIDHGGSVHRVVAA
jgi:glucose/arabinose dehydrogenase